MSRTTNPTPTGKLYRAVCRRVMPFNNPDTGRPQEVIEAFGTYARRQDAWAAVTRESHYERDENAPGVRWTVEVTKTNWKKAPL